MRKIYCNFPKGTAIQRENALLSRQMEESVENKWFGEERKEEGEAGAVAESREP
jgi:hypothetical protein